MSYRKSTVCIKKIKWPLDWFKVNFIGRMFDHWFFFYVFDFVSQVVRVIVNFSGKVWVCRGFVSFTNPLRTEILWKTFWHLVVCLINWFLCENWVHPYPCYRMMHYFASVFNGPWPGSALGIGKPGSRRGLSLQQGAPNSTLFFQPSTGLPSTTLPSHKAQSLYWDGHGLLSWLILLC